MRVIATRLAWTLAGTVLLILGILGILLPVMPGTVFLIGASACYVRGSRRLHRWLSEHRLLGPHLQAVAEGRGMPMKARVISILAMFGGVAFSLTRTDNLAIQIGLVMLALIGTYFICRPHHFRTVRERGE